MVGLFSVFAFYVLICCCGLAFSLYGLLWVLFVVRIWLFVLAVCAGLFMLFMAGLLDAGLVYVIWFIVGILINSVVIIKIN